MHFHVLNCLGVTHECGRQTDEQTDKSIVSNNSGLTMRARKDNAIDDNNSISVSDKTVIN